MKKIVGLYKFDFLKVILIIGLFGMGLSSCATLKRQFCDCAKDPKVVSSTHPEKIPEKTFKVAGPIAVDGSDVELADRMSKALDSYVIKGEKDEFTTLCSDSRFDCFVNDKKFPKSRKKTKRKVPAFMSGSKMGLQNDERVHLKYEFYP